MVDTIVSSEFVDQIHSFVTGHAFLSCSCKSRHGCRSQSSDSEEEEKCGVLNGNFLSRCLKGRVRKKKTMVKEIRNWVWIQIIDISRVGGYNW